MLTIVQYYTISIPKPHLPFVHFHRNKRNLVDRVLADASIISKCRNTTSGCPTRATCATSKCSAKSANERRTPSTEPHPCGRVPPSMTANHMKKLPLGGRQQAGSNCCSGITTSSAKGSSKPHRSSPRRRWTPNTADTSKSSNPWPPRAAGKQCRPILESKVLPPHSELQ